MGQLVPQLQLTVLNNAINLNPLIGTVLGLAGIALPITISTLQLPLVQNILNGLSPITVSAAAIATTTIPNTPVGTCSSLTVAYAGGNAPPALGVLGMPLHSCMVQPLLHLCSRWPHQRHRRRHDWRHPSARRAHPQPPPAHRRIHLHGPPGGLHENHLCNL